MSIQADKWNTNDLNSIQTNATMTHDPKKQSTGNYSGAKKDKHENRDAGDNQKKKEEGKGWVQQPKPKR